MEDEIDTEVKLVVCKKKYKPVEHEL